MWRRLKAISLILKKNKKNQIEKNKKVNIAKNASVHYAKIDYEGNNSIAGGTSISGYLKIGLGSTISSNCYIHGHIIIGKYCQLAGNIGIFSSNHPTNYITTFTSKAFLNGVLKKNSQNGSVNIGNDVWIGHGAIILKDVKIGHGAIIAAGAIVTKDVPPYSIVGGNPARILKFRFSDEIINKLLEIQWWDYSADFIKINIDKFTKPILSIEDLDNFTK
jgi:acetyltransferase-like isoleucine patch superfamily enzyme